MAPHTAITRQPAALPTCNRKQDGIVTNLIKVYILGYQLFVQGGSETSNVVRVGDGGTDEKTGGGDGGGRVEDVKIFIRSDKNGQNQE